MNITFDLRNAIIDHDFRKGDNHAHLKRNYTFFWGDKGEDRIFFYWLNCNQLWIDFIDAIMIYIYHVYCNSVLIVDNLVKCCPFVNKFECIGLPRSSGTSAICQKTEEHFSKKIVAYWYCISAFACFTGHDSRHCWSSNILYQQCCD